MDGPKNDKVIGNTTGNFTICTAHLLLLGGEIKNVTVGWTCRFDKTRNLSRILEGNLLGK
jgi:hypothetical protein